MEYFYISILRIIFGLLTMVGILWAALRYLIKYKMILYRTESREHTDNLRTEVIIRFEKAEADIKDLGVRMRGAEGRLCDLEKK